MVNMRYSDIKGIRISALSLGTVQLGLNYGVNNRTGKPSEQSAFEILDCALARGITALDTARGYGDSEEVIGKWLKTVEPDRRPFVMTKAKHLDHSSLDALRDSLRGMVEQSKQCLGLKQLPLLMLHSCDEYLGDEDHVRTVFDELKASGDIRFSGISAYAYHDWRTIAQSGFDAVQIPLNLFDWRQIDAGGLNALRESGMMIFVRSVYLQGLVFQDPDHLDPRMEFCRQTLIRFRAFCDKYALSPAELAVSFAMSLDGITSLVLGSERKEQVEQNADLFARLVQLNPSQMAELHDAFAGTDSHVLDPTTWFNA